MFNKILLVGRVTSDLELRYTPDEKAVVNMRLAVKRFKPPSSETEPTTDFFKVVIWQKQAENCAKYLRKGSLCLVEGHLQIRTYIGEDNIKRQIAEVIAESVRFLDFKKEKDGQEIGKEVSFDEKDLPFTEPAAELV
jgi:single-strand DNA-binding protein